jgi:hypothetical protein
MTHRHRAELREFLLIESDGLIRGTVASVCRQLNILKAHPAINVSQGEQILREQTVHGVLISVADGEVSLAFLDRLRAGVLDCPADLPVAVMAPSCDQDLALRLKALNVRRLLLRPFRLRSVIHTLEQMLHEAQTAEV